MNDDGMDHLGWTSPVLSLALERVFDFYIDDCMPRNGVSVVARVTAARWLAERARGALRGSPEFSIAARRAYGLLCLTYGRIGGLCVHRWEGYNSLNGPSYECGSVTLVVGSAGSGKTHGAQKLCVGLSKAIAHASGHANNGFDPLDVMAVCPSRKDNRNIDKKVDHRLQQRPRTRVALITEEFQDDETKAPYFVPLAKGLIARGLHVVASSCPLSVLTHPASRRVVDRIVVALGLKSARYRWPELAEQLAALVGVDPVPLGALFAVLPDYAYLWFEPLVGRFGSGHTVITLSSTADFERADASATTLDPRDIV
jgi:hypothetical protein